MGSQFAFSQNDSISMYMIIFIITDHLIHTTCLFVTIIIIVIFFADDSSLHAIRDILVCIRCSLHKSRGGNESLLGEPIKSWIANREYWPRLSLIQLKITRYDSDNVFFRKKKRKNVLLRFKMLATHYLVRCRIVQSQHLPFHINVL